MPLDGNQGVVSQALLGPTNPTAASVSQPKERPVKLSISPAPAPASVTAPPPPQFVQPAPQRTQQVQPDTLPDLAKQLRNSVDELNEEEDQPGPNPPPAPYFPPPPANKPFDPIHAWGSTAMIIAAIGSAFTRQPITTALNAGAKVLNAYKQKNQAAANNDFAVWKAETANALNLQKYQMDQYNKVLNQKNISIRDKISQVQAVSAAFKDAPVIAALQSGGLPAVIALQKKRGQASAMLADHSFDVETSHIASQSADKPDDSGYSKNQWMQIVQNDMSEGAVKFKFAGGKLGDLQKEEYNKAYLQMQAASAMGGGAVSAMGGGLTKKSIDTLGIAFARGVPLSQLTAGLGGKSSEVRSEIENSGINYLISQGKNPISFIETQADYKANQETLNQITKSANSAAAYEKTALDNMNTAESLMPQGIPTNISPVLNQLAAYGEVKTGSPQTLAYGAALATALTEYAKVMAGGTGSAAASSDSARQEASSLISQFGTTAQANAVFSVMRQDMNNRITEYANSIQAINNALLTGQPSTGLDIAPPPPTYTPSPEQAGPPSALPAPAAPDTSAATKGTGEFAGFSMQETP
jgi:hypothetical protein